MDYSNRTYAFANWSDIGYVDFSQVMETSAATVRKSLDNQLFILKWYTANTPTFIVDGSVTLSWSGSHSQCLQHLLGPNWTDTGSMP
tara:strand:+ start:185 stop:445 length:261 start_codon:yes stop_codon:yes gene_type:complete